MKFVSLTAFAAAALLCASCTLASAAVPTGVRDLGQAGANSRVDFSVVMPYVHTAELHALREAQHNPQSPNFRHFLKSTQFQAYFASSPASYAAAAATLRKAGFTLQTYPNRTVLHAVGTAGAAERLFHTRIDAVRESDGRLTYASVNPATLPAALTGSRVVGLSGVHVARTAYSARATTKSNAAPKFVAGPLFGPDGGFGPIAVAKTEDYPVEHGYRGANSNVADIIDGPVTESDVAGFLKYFGIRRGGPRTTTINVDGGCGFDCFDGPQATIDAEWALAMAPDATLFTYEIPSLSSAGIVDGFNAVVSDDAVNVVNFSVGACEANAVDLELALEPIAAQADAEGISIESVAFGGADLCGLGVALPMTPADLSSVTAIGGSTSIVDTTGRLLAQSTLASSNGGVSAGIALPPWQRGIPGIRYAGRNVPDVVLPGSVDGIGPSIFLFGQWLGGFAFVNNAPFAGYLATVQQYFGYTVPLGNFAPSLYAQFSSSGYRGGADAYFLDVKLGNIGSLNGNPVSARPGYDIASGIGSINDGFGLIQSLSSPPAATKP